jgi:hypothetical protein
VGPNPASIASPSACAGGEARVGQARVCRRLPGHARGDVLGFLALFIGTVLATIDWDITLPLFGYKILQGDFYLVYELVLDLFGLFFVVGLGMAVYRRFVIRPAQIDPTAHFAWVLTLLLVINVTGFVMEACRLAVVQPWWGRGRRWATRWVRASGPGMTRGPAPRISAWLFTP